MYNSVTFTIEFTFKGKNFKRSIDKIDFVYTDYSYAIYRIKGKVTNFDLLKAGKWWQVDYSTERLHTDLVRAIGAAIDAAQIP